MCPDLGIGVDLFALSLIALVAVGLGSGERGGVLHAEDHEDDEDDGQRADAEAPAPADAGQRERRHGAADDIAEVPHRGSDAAHEAALIGGHEFADEDGGDVVAAAEADAGDKAQQAEDGVRLQQRGRKHGQRCQNDVDDQDVFASEAVGKVAGHHAADP